MTLLQRLLQWRRGLSSESASSLSATITEFGLYMISGSKQHANPNSPTGFSNDASGTCSFYKTTNRIPAALGVSFGMTVIFQAKAAHPRENQEFHLRLIYRFPSPGIKNSATGEYSLSFESPQIATLGEPTLFSYQFDYESELVPGPWRMELWDRSTKLIEKEFICEIVAPAAVRTDRKPYLISTKALAIEDAPRLARELRAELIEKPVDPFYFLWRRPCNLYWGCDWDDIYWDRRQIFRRFGHLLRSAGEVFRETTRREGKPWTIRGFGTFATEETIVDPLPTKEFLDHLFLGFREVLLSCLALPGFAFAYSKGPTFSESGELLLVKLNISPSLFYHVTGTSNRLNRLVGTHAQEEKEWSTELKSFFKESVGDLLKAYPELLNGAGSLPGDVVQAVKTGYSRLAAFVIAQTQTATDVSLRLQRTEVDGIWPHLLDGELRGSLHAPALTRPPGKRTGSARESAFHLTTMLLRELCSIESAGPQFASGRFGRTEENIVLLERNIPIEEAASVVLGDTTLFNWNMKGIYTTTLFQILSQKLASPFGSIPVLVRHRQGSRDSDHRRAVDLFVIRNSQTEYSVYEMQSTHEFLNQDY